MRPYVSAGPAVVGKPFVVRGRFVDFPGFESEVYVVQVSKSDANGGPVIWQSGGGRATRRQWCAYDVEIELSPIPKPGEYDIGIVPLTNPVFRNAKHAAVVSGKLVVEAAE